MNNFNKVLTVVLVFVAVLVFAQTPPATLPAGFAATKSVTDPAQCQGITGSLFTFCPVSGGTADGFYLMQGTTMLGKVAVGTSGTNDYQLLINKPTTIACSTSSQSNTGFTASACTIK